MIQKIVLFFTILSIIEEYKGVLCENYISEYINKFDSNTFDELNLICYISMRGIIRSAIFYIFNNPGELLPEDTLSDIKNINYMLHRVTGWKKFLINEQTIWSEYNNIMKWRDNPFDAESTIAVMNDIISTFNKSKFINLEMKTPMGIQFFLVFDTKYDMELDEMFINTFLFCKKTLNSLSAPTAIFETSLSAEFTANEKAKSIEAMSIYGCVVLLMSRENIVSFSLTKRFNTSVKFLVYIVHLAIQDIYRGIIYIMKRINIYDPQVFLLAKCFNVVNMDVELLRMMITAFPNVVQLTEVLYKLKDIKGVQEKIYHMNSKATESYRMEYDYYHFQNDFNKLWSQKLFIDVLQIHEGPRSSVISNALIYNGLILPDGTLIKNSEVQPSIIGYYAMFDTSGIHLNNIDYKSNTDHRITLLLELNAWTKVLYQTLDEILILLLNIDTQGIIKTKPYFEIDVENVLYYRTYFK